MHLPIDPQTRSEELYRENLRFRRKIKDSTKRIQDQENTIQDQGQTIQDQEKTTQRLRTQRNHLRSNIESCTQFARDLVQRLGDIDRPPLEDRRGHLSGGDPRRRYGDAV
jgi:hypothetical protein